MPGDHVGQASNAHRFPYGTSFSLSLSPSGGRMVSVRGGCVCVSMWEGVYVCVNVSVREYVGESGRERG